ncbi:MAG TPA: hypothetical protein VER58_03775 [Thermoanaerobaculia bacterium]|nr:hypothetical protein [Thermoanaerobaculia bacterium]
MIRRYRPVILLSLACVVLAFLIIAVSVSLFGPSEEITTQTFRLDFVGAGRGEYPNKTKFNIADIISGPIVTRVWQENHLTDYISFGNFSRSVFVLESNRQYEQLAAEYQAKLADAKLSPVDRERLQREFEQKTESISKNEYAISFDHRSLKRSIPEPLARKVLLDILNDWAEFAVNQQHVIAYQVSVLSPEILAPSAIEQRDLVAAIEVLRSKANRVITNIDKFEGLPGATLARTSKDHMSLEEARIRLDEIMRFRLEPLLAAVVHASGLINDRATTIRFLESQLAYDQRRLESAQRQADSIRESIAVYEEPAATVAVASGAAKKPEQPKSGEAVVPQLSDSFLDRLVSMTGRAADAQYRQAVVADYRKAVADTIPLKQSVAYDTTVLDELRKSFGGGAALSAASVRSEIDQTRTEVGQLINTMNELFQIVSRNMTPSTQLFTLTGPPTTRVLRSIGAPRLALYGLLVLLIALPTIIVLCLLHNRVREEEAEEEYLRQEKKLTTAQTLP